MTEAYSATLRPGALVDGKYRVIQHLSSGGMGDVYEAEHIYTRRRVALKVMHPRAEDGAHRFMREAEAVSAVDHPGVVEMLDAGRDPDGIWYAVFELLVGDDLENRLSEGGLTPPELIAVALKVLEALAATHAQGYVHRDIKPANIFLDHDRGGVQRVKLLDYGIAEPIGAQTSVGVHRVGTLEYMSPEQAAAQPVDGRTDVWSVGAVLFRGLTGRGPVVALIRAELARRLVEEDVEPVVTVRPDLPEDLAKVVDRALARDPAARWRSAEDMAQALMCLDPRTLAALAAPGGAAPSAAPRPLDQRFFSQPTVDLLRPGVLLAAS